MKIPLVVMLSVLFFQNALALELKEPKSCDCLDVMETFPEIMGGKLTSECDNVKTYLDRIIEKCKATWQKDESTMVALQLNMMKLKVLLICNCLDRKDWKGASLEEMNRCRHGVFDDLNRSVQEYGQACQEIQTEKKKKREKGKWWKIW